MTWEWLPFFVGAPVWASIGIVLFARLTVGHRPNATPERPRSPVRERSRESDPDVVSLSAYRLKRMRGTGFVREIVATRRR